VSDLYSPATVNRDPINEELTTAPEKINADAHAAWIMKIELATGRGRFAVDGAGLRGVREGRDRALIYTETTEQHGVVGIRGLSTNDAHETSDRQHRKRDPVPVNDLTPCFYGLEPPSKQGQRPDRDSSLRVIPAGTWAARERVSRVPGLRNSASGGLAVSEKSGTAVVYDSQRLEIGYRIDILAWRILIVVENQDRSRKIGSDP